ncbi:helicase domain-containing protein [Cavenderia fasciculata]|uniref:Helicase domain-containing protein n=1 Tax=Cavenderia fasciculata TaxID=261658 RepID=F4Q5P3_CACFS|nr:helicase domain-containing protein [Cavenderia fasciculata]EGG17302.1 helicase domain-containing protein [Cavenderia fasciculata]|eukprot:XP_004355786.1 helicase domain-containing protein [Cavenderia fasciculata]
MGDYNDDYGYSQVSVTSLPKIVSRKKPATTLDSSSTTPSISKSIASSPSLSTYNTTTYNNNNNNNNNNNKKIDSTTTTTTTTTSTTPTSISTTSSALSTPSIEPTKLSLTTTTTTTHIIQEIEDDDEDENNNNKNNTSIDKLKVFNVDDDDVIDVKDEEEEELKPILLPMEEQDDITWDPWETGSSNNLDKFLETRIKKSFANKNNLAPRDHQWKTIRDVVKDLAYPKHIDSFQGKRYNYLIQHAAGSGKSITIATLVYCLYKLEINNKLKFDTIVIMNDRSQLDAQLGDVIVKFLEANGVTNYCRPKSSKQLQSEISYGKRRIVITTMQKFAQLLPNKNGNADFSFKTNSVAIISDEAHRSHGKSTTEKLHEFLVGKTRQTSQITYFSFTCTPTPQCLEMFGVSSNGRDKKPFYTYSMEDALKDKLILDVIENFNSFQIKSDYGLSHLYDGKYWDEDYYDDDDDSTFTMQDVPQQTDDKRSIQEKCIYILNHFIETKKKYDTGLLKARGMIVCSGRKNLLDYKKIIDEIVSKLPPTEQFDTIAAFSPFVIDGKTILESDSSVNGKYASYGSDKHRGIVKALQDDKHSRIRLLIVADKLQTGFDEPSLCMMYVDKKISGANVVQTLSRLSRISKDKKTTSIIDFVNNEKEVRQIFKIYQNTTTLRSLTGDSELVSKLYSTASTLKRAYAKERNMTVFARSMLYHQKQGDTEYNELEYDLEEFIDCYEQLLQLGTDVKKLQLPIEYDILKTLQKTIHTLKDQNLKKEREKAVKKLVIKIRMDYLTDKESNSSLESSSSVDYDAEFAAQLWAGKKKEESPEEKKEKEVARLKELTRKLEQEHQEQQKSRFSFSSGGSQSRYKPLGSGDSNNNNNGSAPNLGRNIFGSGMRPKSALFSNSTSTSSTTTSTTPTTSGKAAPAKRKESVWALAKKSSLGKRPVGENNDDNNNNNNNIKPTMHGPSPQPLKRQYY